jgi:glycosyltransferase involved in cell wall biosynthesis
MPRVSVIVPNYNHGRFLERRFASICDQTFNDFEVIFVDDASTDESREVYRRFAADDGRFHGLFHEHNSGNVFIQWNRGVRAARGEYVWIAEADDIADPRLLERLVTVLARNPNVGLAYCLSAIIDERNRLLGDCQNWLDSVHPTRYHSDFVADGREECARYLIQMNTIPNASAVLFRRSVYEKAGMADETMRFCGDWMMYVEILLVSDVGYVAESLNYFRTHWQTTTTTHLYSALHLAEELRIVARIVQDANVPPDARWKARDRRMKMWRDLALGQKRKATLVDHWRLYELAKTVDPQLPARTVLDVMRHHLYTKTVLAPLRPLARGMAQLARRIMK